MLTILFLRAVKRNVIGLLALGEWGPPTGAPVAVTGILSSDQPHQESLLEGTVEQPSVVFHGGRVGVWVEQQDERERQEVRGFCHSEQQPQHECLSGELEFVGSAATFQAIRFDLLSGNLESVGVCETGQGIQRSELVGYLAFIGPAATQQSAQNDALIAQLQFIGEAASGQHAQDDALPGSLGLVGNAQSHQESQDGMLFGETIDVELEMITALLIEAA